MQHGCKATQAKLPGPSDPRLSLFLSMTCIAKALESNIPPKQAIIG